MDNLNSPPMRPVKLEPSYLENGVFLPEIKQDVLTRTIIVKSTINNRYYM